MEVIWGAPRPARLAGIFWARKDGYRLSIEGVYLLMRFPNIAVILQRMICCASMARLSQREVK